MPRQKNPDDVSAEERTDPACGCQSSARPRTRRRAKRPRPWPGAPPSRRHRRSSAHMRVLHRSPFRHFPFFAHVKHRFGPSATGALFSFATCAKGHASPREHLPRLRNSRHFFTDACDATSGPPRPAGCENLHEPPRGTASPATIYKRRRTRGSRPTPCTRTATGPGASL